jgi:type IV fimbrial biogenesis protein FimT
MYKYQKAFTLIELMVTVTIAAIVLGIAIPSFNTQIQNSRSVALGEELASAFNFARSEAVKRGQRVSICASSDGAVCGGGWNGGWMVFLDGANTDNAAAAVVSNVLRYWDDIDNRAVVTVSNNKTFVRFTGLGALGRVDNNIITVSARFEKCVNNNANTITIGLSGIVNTERDACPAGGN